MSCARTSREKSLLSAVFALLFVWQPATLAKPAAAPPQTLQAKSSHLVVTVVDETAVVVPSAVVILSPPGKQVPLRGSTNFAGRWEFADLAPGGYRLQVEKEGFYAVAINEVRVPETESLEVTLNHQQEYKETVHVIYSPPAIDPAQTATTENLSGAQVIQLPYPTTRDVRNALSLIPGVLPDINGDGQAHVAGAASNQVLYALDGFDISQPVRGLLDLRVSTDAVRSIDVESSRTSAQFGRGSAGVLNLETGMGDDHFRFFATDFIPSFQQRRGFNLQNATPRFTFSGPVSKGKAWFYEAVEGEYDLNIKPELPPGQDRDRFWRLSDLARVQLNLTSGNRLIGSFVVNRSHQDHTGLSITQPLSTTTDQTRSAYFVTVKDQANWGNGVLLEVGFGLLQFGADALPLGTLPYVQFPGTAAGNSYLTSNSTVRRFESLANLFLPPFKWHGRHQFTIGTNLERTNDRQFAIRQPFSIVSATGSLERSVSFTANPRFEQNLFAASGFAQDRWLVSDRLLLEPGVRFDADDILHRGLVSPRLAGTYMLTRNGETKASAGIGVYYDRTDLDLLTRALAGQRQDVFFAADGVTPLGPPVVTIFQADPRVLEEPRFLNWSVGLERKLPAAIYLKAEFLEKRGTHGFDYQNVNDVISPAGIPTSGLFVLRNDRRDCYDGVTVSLQRTFKKSYPLLIAYTHSKAHSNAILDSTLDNPFFSQQLGGPLPWDAPDRVLSWGAAPFSLPRLGHYDLVFTFDWRTGYPFSLVNREQELVGLPDRARFPDYAALNVHVEKRFRLFGFEWAIRGGFNNVTSRKNPSAVNNNVDSPSFGQFGGFQHRAFTGRIRFLGRK